MKGDSDSQIERQIGDLQDELRRRRGVRDHVKRNPIRSLFASGGVGAVIVTSGLGYFFGPDALAGHTKLSKLERIYTDQIATLKEDVRRARKRADAAEANAIKAWGAVRQCRESRS